MAEKGYCPIFVAIRRVQDTGHSVDCIGKSCQWYYELTDKHGSCSVSFGALMLHELLNLLQQEKKKEIWKVDAKTGAALLGRAGWTRNHHGNWASPKGDLFCPIDVALYSLGLELEDG